MKTLNRAKIRGKALLPMCKSARVCTEIGDNTKYCFCYGIIDLHYDDYIDECEKCKACVKNMPNSVKEFKSLEEVLKND